MFLSVDPLVSRTGTPYLYANGNPSTLSDPAGLAPGFWCGPKTACISSPSNPLSQVELTGPEVDSVIAEVDFCAGTQGQHSCRGFEATDPFLAQLSDELIARGVYDGRLKYWTGGNHDLIVSRAWEEGDTSGVFSHSAAGELFNGGDSVGYTMFKLMKEGLWSKNQLSALTLTLGFIGADDFKPVRASTGVAVPKSPVPPGFDPETWSQGPGSRRYEYKNFWDPEGGEWRYHQADKWHPDSHWDYNPWSHPYSPWQNVPLDGVES